MCRSIAVVALLLATVFADRGQAQSLHGIGMLATGTMSRARSSGDTMYTGDVLHVEVLQRGNCEDMYVSVHCQIRSNNSGNWTDVEATNSELGAAYRGGKYRDYRDFVFIDGTDTPQVRTVTLFMPYDAADIREGNYTRRYVIRLWNGDNGEIAAKALEPDNVTVNRFRDRNATRTLISTVSVKSCAPAAAAGAPIEPIPETPKTPSRSMRFFNAQTGKWVCR